MIVFIIGDVYGSVGRAMIKGLLPKLRQEFGIDWVIANGENVTGGVGISHKHADFLFQHGVDVITSGNHLFARRDWPEVVNESENLLRPHNIGGDRSPGKGWIVIQQPEKPSLAVINLTGRIFMERADCPFRWAETLLSRLDPAVPVIVDFHAEATSEKIAMAWHLDGKVSFVAGTHTHVQTSDERILPLGTGTITDLGMTGPRDGILGVERNIVLDRFVKGFSERFSSAPGPGVMEGVIIDIDPEKKTREITRIRVL